MKKKYKLVILFLLLMHFCSLLINNFIYNRYDNNNSPNFKVISSDITVEDYFIPGVTWSLPLDRVIKIGVLNDMDDISGEHAWEGAVLAAKETNEAGGIVINGTRYFIGLVSEDTEEMVPALNVSKAINAAQTMVNNHTPHFITGGFRAEALQAYQEEIMDAQIPFLSTGAAPDVFCENVYTSYARYKYFFRMSPINTTSLTMQLISYLLNLADYLNTTYNTLQLKLGILRENLTWAEPISNALNYTFSSFYPNITTSFL